MFRRLLLFLLLGLTAARAQTNVQGVPPPVTQPFFSRIRGLFDFELPSLDPAGTVKLIFYPHVGDLIHRNYLRTDLGFRWALNTNLEFSTEAASYFTHGMRGAKAGSGLGELRFGAKYVFPRWLRPQHEASVAFNFSHPNGSPPLDLTDGLNHYQPSLTIQRHSLRNPKLTTFASAGLDLITSSSSRGNFGINQPRENSFSLTGGAIYDLGQFKWTFSTTCTTTALIGARTGNFLYVRPSVLWYVPKKYTFHSKTQWIVGLGLHSAWGPDGFNFGVDTRLRAEITFRQAMNRLFGHVKTTTAP